MTGGQPTGEACRARGRGRRWALRCCVAGAGLVALLVVAVGAAVTRLVLGPVDLGFIADDVASGIASSLGPDHRVRFSSLTLEWAEGSPRITVSGLEIARADGAPIATAPRAFVGLGLAGLAGGRIEPVSLVARSPVLGLTIRTDGTIARGGPDPERERARPTPAIALIDPDLIGRGLSTGGGASSGGALRRVSLSDVTVTIRDERTGIARTYGEIDVEIAQLGETGMEGLVSAAGVRGRWRIAASLEDAVDGRRPLTIAADGVTVADLAGPEAGGLAGLSLALRFRGDIAADGRLERLDGAVTLGGQGVMEGPGWRAEVAPMRLDLSVEPERRVIELSPSLVRLGDIGGRVSGRFVLPAPDDPTKVVRLNLALDQLRVDAAGPVPELDRLVASGSYEMGSRTLWIDRAEAIGPGGSVAEARGQIALAGPTPGIRLEARAGNLSALSVKRIWPHAIAPEAQEWFVQNVEAGHLDRAEIALDIPPGFLDGRPLLRDMYRGEYRVRDGTVRLSPELPPITGVSGVVRSTGTSVRVEASGGRIDHATGGANLPTITFTSDGMDVRTTAVGVLEARAEGGAGALLAIGDAQGLPVARGGGFDTRAITGDGVANVRVTFPIFPGPDAPQQTTTVDAELTNITGRGIVEGRDLERGNFRLTTEGDSFALEGTATIMGLPARLSARQDGARRLTLRAEVDTDDQSRARLGFNLAPYVSGPVALRLTREAVGNDAVRRLEADLVQARLAVEQIAFEKAAGVPATLALVLRGQNRITGVDDVVLNGRGFGLRGRARLAEDGTPTLVELTDVRLRPEDSFNARVELGEGRLQVRVTGRQVDIRPFLRNVMSEDEPTGEGGRLDLSVRVDRARGHNGATLNDLRLDLVRAGARMTEFAIAGSFGGATRITGEVLSERGRPYLRLISTDGGAALRFLDLYRNMRGGRLTVTQTLTDPTGRRSDGVLYIEDFRVVNDEGLQRLFGAAPQDPEGSTRRVSGGDVAFDRMRVVFSRSPGTIQLSEGVLRNANVGITFEGRMDSRRQAVDLRGVFIPAFALNNLIARIPVVGAFMGGQNEGLIGVTYAVVGPLSGPTLRINPVSAIAPGFLRQIFAFPDQPTGALPQRRTPQDATGN
jgi:hypothetical protein